MHKMAIKHNVPFYSDYTKASEISYSFEHQINDKFIEEYNKLMIDYVIKDNKQVLKKIQKMNTTVLNKYVHLSSHYGGLNTDFLILKSGENHLLKDYLYVNKPVKESNSKSGKINYKRKIYYVK